MRNLPGVIRIAATWTLLTATVGIAAPPRWAAQSPSDIQAVGTGLRTLPAAAGPGMPEPIYPPAAERSPYGDLWAGYRPDYPHPPMGACQCGCNAASGCADRQGAIHKLFDKMTDRMHRLWSKSRGCDCGGCGVADEPSCAADCDSACDALGPATSLPMMQPYIQTIRPYNPPSPPAVEPSDPFEDDPLTQASARQEISEAAYYEP